MLDNSKLAQRATHGSGYRVGGLGQSSIPPPLAESLALVVRVCAAVSAPEKTQHMQVWRVDLFAFNSDRASSRLPVRQRFMLVPARFWGTGGDEASMRVFSVFFSRPFILAARE